MTPQEPQRPAPIRTVVNGVPIIGVPVQDLIERNLEEAIPVDLWNLFAEAAERIWRPEPIG